MKLLVLIGAVLCATAKVNRTQGKPDWRSQGANSPMRTYIPSENTFDAQYKGTPAGLDDFLPTPGVHFDSANDAGDLFGQWPTRTLSTKPAKLEGEHQLPRGFDYHKFPVKISGYKNADGDVTSIVDTAENSYPIKGGMFNQVLRPQPGLDSHLTPETIDAFTPMEISQMANNGTLYDHKLT